VLLLSGPIFGLRMRKLMRATAEFGRTLGKPVATFSLLDEIFLAEGDLPANPYQDVLAVGELMDGYTYQFRLQRESALSQIARKIDKLPPETAGVIVRVPATVPWRHINVQFKDHCAIAETLAPDRVLTVINAEWKIKEWLDARYGKRALKLIAGTDDASLTEILQWVGNEVSAAEDLTAWCSEINGRPIRHHVIGSEAPAREDRSRFLLDVENLLKAVTTAAGQLPSFYASYSMTVSGKKERRIINDAVWGMRERGLVVDPATIEIGASIPKKDKAAVHAYTVLRDLLWDVRNVDRVCAIHPYQSRPPQSTGMLDELGHARAFKVERYLVMPSGAESPFTAGNYVPANHLFDTTEQLFGFLDRRGVKPRWAEQVSEFAALPAAEPASPTPRTRKRQ
jgi:hypothetical protein